MMIGKYAKYSAIAGGVIFLGWMMFGVTYQKTYRTNDLKIKVVSGKGEAISEALVVAAWLDRCAPHGSFREVVVARELFTDMDGVILLPGMEIETTRCIDQSEPSIGVYHPDYDFLGRSASFKKERTGFFEYELIYEEETRVVGRRCADCWSETTKVSMILSKVEYHEMTLEQKKSLPVLEDMVERAGLDRKVGK